MADPTRLVAAQPVEWQVAVAAALRAPEIHMAMCLHLDFADGALNLCSRTLPFTDLQHGRVYRAGAGLLVGLPSALDMGDDNLAPWREYHLGFPTAQMEQAGWFTEIMAFCGAVENYRARAAEMALQLFHPATGAPLGWPIVQDVGVMDRMRLRWQPGGAVVTLSTEGLLARKGVPVYGMQTYQDQLRRYPRDEGMQFTVEAGKLITWINW